jgi:hypothetical protein
MESGNLTLPTDSYQEPDDKEIFFNLKKQTPPPGEQMPIDGKTDGQFGHAFEDEKKDNQ